MAKIGLFFGTFNPIHIGHLIIANHIVENSDLEEVWLVVSPQNPFKKSINLLSEYNRLHLVNLAINDNEKLRACDIEFNLPKPSYTIDTLVYLKEKYPNNEFQLIMGSDNLKTLHKWKNGDVIAQNHKIIVYERPDAPVERANFTENIQILETPLLHISATFIRKSIQNGNSCKYLLHPKVQAYIEEMNFYK